jgi:hypothetical protein
MITSSTTRKLDGLTLTVESLGEGTPPWEDWTVFRYQVTVEDEGGNQYVSDAWGSRHDYENGETDEDGIGWMVLDELLSAAYDPDEFFSMAIEGNNARARAEQILAMVATAEAMFPALKRNQDTIEAHR